MKETKIKEIFNKSNIAIEYYNVYQQGFLDALKEIEQQKEIEKQARKNKKILFEPEKFVVVRKDRCIYGVWHEEGKEVVTDGRYIVVHNTDYDKELEHKLTDKNKQIINDMFVNWKKVIPTVNLVDCTAFTIKEIKEIATSCKERSLTALDNIRIRFHQDGKIFVLNMHSLKKLALFLASYPESSIQLQFILNKELYQNRDFCVLKVCDEQTQDVFVATTEGNKDVTFDFLDGELKPIKD